MTNWAQARDGCLNNVTRKFGIRMKERRGVEGRLAIRVSARVVQSKMSDRETPSIQNLCRHIFF